jgi:hypothetical protein
MQKALGGTADRRPAVDPTALPIDTHRTNFRPDTIAFTLILPSESATLWSSLARLPVKDT